MTSIQQVLNDGGLMIVESPTKAKEITKFLPSNGKWKVVPTIGFMFELAPSKQVPETKKQDYGEYSIRVNDLSFDRLLVHDPQNRKQYAEIKRLIQSGAYKHFYVSTDPDEAGELIGREVVQHLTGELRKAGMDVRRASWHEITRKAVEEGLEHYGAIDEDKADSAEARQVYDRLFGFSVSRYLWRTAAGKSGGRAQSPCLRLIVDREKERLGFVKAQYNSVTALACPGTGTMPTTLKTYGGRPIATGSSFDANGKLTNTAQEQNHLILDDRHANAIIAEQSSMAHMITGIAQKPTTRNPRPPYTTSTFQQEVGNRLGMGSKQVMQVAQKLFEAGCITYLRSDAVTLSDEALTETRRIITSMYGASELPPAPRKFKNGKNVQEGHEAIRPATQDDGTFLDPVGDAGKLNAIVPRGADVYALVWKRTIASQMNPAKGMTTTVTIGTVTDDMDRKASFTTTGTVFSDLGWMQVYGKGQGDENDTALPPVEEGQAVKLVDWKSQSHSTMPPARFTEPQLVAKLEELGIGRPSTYANIVTVNQDRGYVQKHGGALAPTWQGMKVAQLLEAKVPQFVSYGYTADMEGQLDDIASGDLPKNRFLESAWAGPDGVDAKVNGLTVDWDDVNTVTSIHLPSGYQVRVNKHGAWLEDPGSPVDGNGYRKGVKIDDKALLEEDGLNSDACASMLRDAAGSEGPRVLGVVPDGPYKGWQVSVRSGRFGPYAQAVKLGRTGKPVKGSKPVNQSLGADAALESLSFDDVLPLFMEVKLPRNLDSHFFVGIGKRGPWMGYRKTAKSRKAQFKGLPDGYDPRTVTLEEVKALWERS